MIKNIRSAADIAAASEDSSLDDNQTRKGIKGKVLLIEDDLSSAKIIQLALARESYDVSVCNFGDEAVSLVSQRNFDIILLDLMLPDKDGIEVLKKIRSMGSSVPILILSGLKNMEKKLTGLQLGADDYVTKPFDRRELLARLAALIRRSRMEPADSRLKVAGLSFDDPQQCVYHNGKPIGFTKKEYAVLRALAVANGEPVSKSKILEEIYRTEGSPDRPKPKIIDVFVYKIRSKLMEATGGKDLIQTHWRRGLALRDKNS